MKQIGLFGLAFGLSAVVIFHACKDDGSVRAQEVVDKAIEAHGAHLFANKKVSFDFRGRSYAAERKGGDYIYRRSFTDSAGIVNDVLVNSTDFSRQVDGVEVQLSEEWQRKYGNSVNSVLYFVEILYRLNDAAVNKTYEGQATIKGQTYHAIKVTFGEDNGGEDFEDEYRFWIHTDDHTLDYLAYNYLTDGGGVRFREAFDRQAVGGITFQNYINFKPASKETPLAELPEMYEGGALEELSRIENSNIAVQ